MLRILAYALGAFGVIGTVVPFLRYDDWWIRGFDYPRQQLVVILAIAAVFWAFSQHPDSWVNWLVGISLFSATFYQAYRIYPYTRLHGKDAHDARKVDEPESHLSLMMSNVLQTNRRSDLLLEVVEREDPDILLTVETNKWWEDRLSEGLGDRYPHRVAVPLENLYGMHLWSKIELVDPEVTYRIKDDIPGISTTIALENGREIDLRFVHPMPPSPSEAYASTGRDAELALVGLEVKNHPGRTAIVAGDLNDVAWSHSSRLFQRISGLLDPRRGRGLFSTFHAEYPLLRWPLDHVFHSSDLAVVDLKRLPYIGSDHFPVLIKLSYEPEQDEQQGEKPQDNDMKEAEETISKGKRHEDDAVLKNQD